MISRRELRLIKNSPTYVILVKDEAGFNPNSDYIAKALDEFLEKGGKITKLKSYQDIEKYTKIKGKSCINQTVNKPFDQFLL